ncbi:MAG TPA: PASTA domain-containing protein, partial [Jatrophihabitans sp.]|nr:PASTA domain-containing protein [Jatrophihabitans sp.]
RGESAMNVAYPHVHNRVPAPSSRLRAENSIPPEIDELVIAATDRDPTGRPSDAAAFLAEIADIRAALALPVTPVPARPRAARPARPADERRRTPETLTTAGLFPAAGQHDTTMDPARAVNGRRAAEPQRPARSTGVPPPVVIPPPEDPAAAQKRRRRRRAVIIVVVLLLVGAAVGYTSWYYASGRYSRVPILHGASQSDAVSKLEDAGYRVKLQPGPEWDETVTKGKVLRTDPAGGTRAVKGKQILLVLSAGPHYYPVKPIPRDTSPEDARSILQSVGPVQIVAKPHPEYSDSVANGDVTRTSPPAGSHVTRKQPITIYYSIGPPTIDVPNIEPGTPLSDAKAALRKAKFKVATEERFSDTISRGLVISMTPNDRATKFSTVTLTVSKGPENVRVPDIVLGDPVNDVKEALTEIGLVPDVKVVDGDASEASKVLTVSPAAGTTVPVGTVVTVYAYPG